METEAQTTTSKKRRSVASIVDEIRRRTEAQKALIIDAEGQLALQRVRLEVMHKILADAEKNGSDDE